MKLTRDITTKIHFILDQILPPILRDSKFLMYPVLLIVYGKKHANFLLNFKERAPFMNEKELAKVYVKIDKVTTERETDLNKGCIKEILRNIRGSSVLEAGCGKGLLSHEISKLGHQVTASDMCVRNETKLKYPKIVFINENVENLSFKNNEFDTVICTHTLEHVQNPTKAIDEIKRVAKKRIIIVVPKQRPYKYTFDPHLYFFPYKHSFLQIAKPDNKYVCKVIAGDIFYIEDF